jgi:hypothetical protein
MPQTHLVTLALRASGVPAPDILPAGWCPNSSRERGSEFKVGQYCHLA